VNASPHRAWVVAFWGYIALLASISLSAYLRLLPRDTGLLSLPHVDHVLHFVLLGTASFLSHRALGGRRIRARSRCLRLPLGPSIVGAASIADECFQALVPSRTFDLLDMASNVSGVLLFGLLAEWLIRRSVSRPSLSARSPSPPSPPPGERADPPAP